MTSDRLIEAIQKAIRSEIEKIIDEEIASFQKTVEQKVRGRVASIASNVSQRLDFQTAGQIVTIRVDFSENLQNKNPYAS